MESKHTPDPSPSPREGVKLTALEQELRERLQAIIDWADFALAHPMVFDDHGVRNLDGPIFDKARTALARLDTEKGEAS